jgi:hypothetical protein
MGDVAGPSWAPGLTLLSRPESPLPGLRRVDALPAIASMHVISMGRPATWAHPCKRRVALAKRRRTGSQPRRCKAAVRTRVW